MIRAETKASLRRYQRGLQDGPDLHCRETEELTFFPPQAPSLEQQYPPLHPSASLVVPRLCEPWRCPPRAVSLARRAMLLSLGVWSRDEVVRVDLEGSRVLCPGLADGLEGGSPSEPLEVKRAE